MAKKQTTTVTDGALAAPPTMQPMIVVFQITGVSPLLQNNPAEFIGKTESTAITTKKQYNDEDEARARLYVNADGHFCHPSEAFIKSAIKAVRGKKFGKVHAAGTLMGAVFVPEEYSVIDNLDGQPAASYEINRKPVVVGKARVLRCRPQFTKWQMKVALDIDTAIITADHVLQALQLAGRTVGVGDYRPEKGGGFGRFTAALL